MRLVCPNCDAQYEVEDGAIPDAGRDVQCSNCGHAWFQLPPDLEAEVEAEEALFGAPQGKQAPQPAPSQTLAKPPEADSGAADLWDDDESDDDEEGAASPEDEGAPDTPAAAAQGEPAIAEKPDAGAVAAEQMPQPTPPRRGLDESLLNVLREEAERESAVRRSETPRPLESQTELGLEETTGATSAAKAVRDRLARLRGQETEPETTQKPAARRDLLPDIEEINSTLRSSTENRSGDEVILAEAEPEAPSSKTGFRSGFSLMLLIAVLLIVTYLAAPKMAQQFPASKATLDGYVAAVDAGRIWLDDAMRNAISALQGLTGGEKS
jgi:predicted Zn finger-like uncharacterized protein